jgi:4'-phosphopantetheinyl transferase EntD
MTRTLRLREVEVALALLFPPGVAVAAEAIGQAHEARLWPEERAAIARSVPARRAEFAAGRAAARRALAALGEPPIGLAVGADRAPVWPAGIFGSISHAAGVAVAAVSRTGPVGVDVEEDGPVEPNLWPIILHPDELACLPPHGAGRLVRQMFAAKESVFKAQKPQDRVLFGFDVLGVRLGERRFEARFRTSIGGFAQGQVVQGHLARAPGLILAGACT